VAPIVVTVLGVADTVVAPDRSDAVEYRKSTVVVAPFGESTLPLSVALSDVTDVAESERACPTGTDPDAEIAAIMALRMGYAPRFPARTHSSVSRLMSVATEY
jgi:hypothetical protein